MIGIRTGLKKDAQDDSVQSLPWYNPSMDEVQISVIRERLFKDTRSDQGNIAKIRA